MYFIHTVLKNLKTVITVSFMLLCGDSIEKDSETGKM